MMCRDQDQGHGHKVTRSWWSSLWCLVSLVLVPQVFSLTNPIPEMTIVGLKRPMGLAPRGLSFRQGFILYNDTRPKTFPAYVLLCRPTDLFGVSNQLNLFPSSHNRLHKHTATSKTHFHSIHSCRMPFFFLLPEIGNCT